MEPTAVIDLPQPALGPAFRAWRESEHLSRAELARAVGISERKIEAIEADEKPQGLGPAVAAKLRAYMAGRQDLEARLRGMEARIAMLEKRISAPIP